VKPACYVLTALCFLFVQCFIFGGLKKNCIKAVDSLAAFVALKVLCKWILKLLGSQVATKGDRIVYGGGALCMVVVCQK